MALDMAKYRKLFLEESAEHLGEISRALLELEKDTGSVDSIDTIFRMAHSIKSMAASMGYDSIEEVAHRLEDRMERIRRDSRLESSAELSVLFRGLEGLERLVSGVRESGEAPPVPAGVIEALMAPPAAAHDVSESDSSAAGEAKKKARRTPSLAPRPPSHLRSRRKPPRPTQIRPKLRRSA